MEGFFMITISVLNIEAIKSAAASFKGNLPFDHCAIDNFFSADFAKRLEWEFPNFDDKVWHEYNNPIEIKKTLNNWNVFKPLTYQTFTFFNSPEFLRLLSDLFGVDPLFADGGLNGGGLHIHKRGGKLNTHLDYSIHPKIGAQRKLNLLVYLNSNWKPEWRGQLGLWEADNNKPGKLVKEYDAVFNRAIVFDTTQESWHGLPEPLLCPNGECRKSLAVYYLTTPPAVVDTRGKALFHPTKEQEGDSAILELIARRSNVDTAKETYR
jgi:hypothetical protein